MLNKDIHKIGSCGVVPDRFSDRFSSNPKPHRPETTPHRQLTVRGAVFQENTSPHFSSLQHPPPSSYRESEQGAAQSSGEISLQTQELVSFWIKPNGVAEVTLRPPSGKAVVTFNHEMLTQLDKVVGELSSLARRGKLSSVVFKSCGKGCFVAGADIKEFANIETYLDVQRIIKQGQDLFNRVAALPVPTVAVVEGVCLGGGLEFALACDRIVALDSPKTELGFPEVQLGIIPGWGGTQRLPRKIGLPNALKLILTGKRVSVKEAEKIGLVDAAVTNWQDLEQAVEDALLAGKRGGFSEKVSFFDKLTTTFSPLRNAAKKSALRSLKKRISHHFEAPFAALEAVTNGLRWGIEEGLLNERSLVSVLALSPQSHSLVKIFLGTERLKEEGKRAEPWLKKAKVGVVGAGVMGAGIAAAFTKKAGSVAVSDISEEQLERAREHIKRSLKRSKSLTEEEKNKALNALTLGDNSNLSDANLVIEAVVEREDVKRKLFEEISKRNREGIIATNTSSLSVQRLSQGVENPARFAGLHFFNPAEVMKLVEIIPAKETSQETVDRLKRAVTELGKLPVVVRDVPGFLVNRILTPYLNQAVSLLKEGYTVEDIDKAAREFGMPMGPLRLLDEIGLDVAVHVAETISRGYPDRMEYHPEFKKIVEAGLLGKKGNKGFYTYEADKKGRKKEGVNKDIYNLLGVSPERKKAGVDLNYLADRLILPLVNEAVRALDEGVSIGEDFSLSALQVDLASVYGIGFAPFRGGVISYANTLGAKNLLNRLKELERHGPAYKAAYGVWRRAKEGKSFFEEI
ncbi:MAG: hypothetical protein D6780_00760 [Candidatus Dadabacteria bacterium]|nr:MAG: hypothetical protein D6780_00760 [Candidatus Dadabacteria bacterium]